MGSFQERIVAYANLLALSKELDQLRERVTKAEKLCAAPKPTEAEGRQLSLTSTCRSPRPSGARRACRETTRSPERRGRAPPESEGP
jgi:hypothetical protein